MHSLSKNILVYALMALVAVGVLPVVGCGSDPSADLLNNPRPVVPDVPLPTNFTLEELRSRSLTNGDLRFVDHLYKGSADKSAVVRFFESQMPVSHWTQLTNQMAQGSMTLDFAKDREKCRITVSDGSFGSTWIHVSIWPDATGSGRKFKKSR